MKRRQSALPGSGSAEDLAIQPWNEDDCDAAQSDRAGLLTLGHGAPWGSDPLPFMALEQEGQRCREASTSTQNFLLRRPRLLQRAGDLALLRQRRCWCSGMSICDSCASVPGRIWQHLSIHPDQQSPCSNGTTVTTTTRCPARAVNGCAKSSAKIGQLEQCWAGIAATAKELVDEGAVAIPHVLPQIRIALFVSNRIKT